jgi:hypothetical protein
VVLTAVNINLEVFCNVSPYGVVGATVLKGFVAHILTLETEVTNSSETFARVEKLLGYILKVSIPNIIWLKNESLFRKDCA